MGEDLGVWMLVLGFLRATLTTGLSIFATVSIIAIVVAVGRFGLPCLVWDASAFVNRTNARIP